MTDDGIRHFVFCDLWIMKAIVIEVSSQLSSAIFNFLFCDQEWDI